MEDINHLILHCPIYQNIRIKDKRLQQPYISDEKEIIGTMLFSDNISDIENTKDTLIKIWIKRDKKLKELSQD